jgi:phage portal protein BeeE
VKLTELWPFRALVQRTVVPVIQDMWALITGSNLYPRPNVADLEEAYEECGAVYSCVKEIAEAICSAEVHAGAGIKTLLEHPNSLQDWSAFVTQMMAAKLCTGSVYILKAPLGSQALQELHVLRTSCVEPIRGMFKQPIMGIRYDDGINRFTAKPDELIIWVSPSARQAVPILSGPVSPVAAEWSSVLVDQGRSKYQRETLKRLPYLVGVVETEGATSKPQRDDLQTSLESIMGGKHLVMPQGAHMVAPGIVDDFSLTDMAAGCEARLCASFGIHPLLVGFIVGLQNSPWSQYSEARKSFYVETIDPLLVQLSDLFTRGLGADVQFKLKEDEEAKQQQVTQAGRQDSEGAQRIPDKP